MNRDELLVAAHICTTEKGCVGCPALYEAKGQCIDELIAGLANALENNPKPVNYIADGYADGEFVYDMAECPNCGRVYFEGELGWVEPFCSKCGQRLDWSENG